ncbi:hypothetical protein [Polynucleobacter sp. 80A-SIGWE]|uniref:hypothetical protein n=1 Tax=Polynucleobacter sp. 80A-SIGWE TaxID=2689100 RepID=UPI001C0B438F|nr:hypothetical protein [Polynucleobacter sp. 80A-SIGWE]MBU3588518.1 hypothetical protein [Polynucleobacter sp. 80A-SIGWE]
MPNYQLSTKEKKNVVDTQTYSKDGHWLQYSETYRWGSIWFDSDDLEDFNIDEIDLENPDGIDVGLIPFDEHDYSDGVSNALNFSPNFPAADQEQFEAIFEADGFETLASQLYKMGWSDDYETMFYGPLELVEC